MQEPELILEATAYTIDQLIHRNVPQIALAGRSNVGKSSLINALARRRALAKVSATPGKTRSVNYYRVSPYDFCLVDLPGYGYARAGLTCSSRATRRASDCTSCPYSPRRTNAASATSPCVRTSGRKFWA